MDQSKGGPNTVTKRLQMELRSLMISGSPGISAFPEGDNLFRWIGTIEGGKGTYPIEAVRVKFETPCFHPNVDGSGNICLDILKEKWSALYDVRTILLSIQSLLGEPNIASPLNEYAAKLWSDQTKYKQVLLEKYNTDVENSRSSNQAPKHS